MLAEVENRSGHRVKTLWSENGGEYTARAFKQYFSGKGIRHQKTISYIPMQNGVVERINRMIQEMVTTILQHSRLKLEFWDEGNISLLDKSITVTSNTVRRATGTMVK